MKAREISVLVPMLVPSSANLREHWAARAKRTKAQRSAAFLASRAKVRALKLPVVVTLVRVSPRPLDSDNLASALKAVRDGVADALGVPDNHPRVGWRYGQEQGKHFHGLRIEVAEVVEAAT